MFDLNGRVHSTAAVALALALFAQPAVADSPIDQCQSVLAKTVERIVLSPGDSKAAHVEGLLRKPKGAGPHPAIVFLHGHGGLRPPRCYEWALERYTGWGYVTLVVDSLSGRLARGGYSIFQQGNDAVLAHRALSQMSFVDSKRIGIVGHSRGGAASIDAISAEEDSADAPAFRAAVAFYPMCFLQRTVTLRAPLLILIGEADQTTSADACREMKVNASGHAYELKSYPKAEHLFDLPWWGKYRAEDTRDAVARTKAFLAKYLLVAERQ